MSYFRNFNFARYFRYAAVGTAVICAKEYYHEGFFNIDERLVDKTIIITGANGGIGRALTLQLAETGATIIMACRNMTDCQKKRRLAVFRSENKNIFCYECDLSSLDSIKQFADSVKRIHPKVHYLINNAGVMHCPKSTTKDGIEMQLGTNYIGHFYLTKLLLNKLKESAPSRIVNVVNNSYTEGHINFDDFNSTINYDPVTAFNQSQLSIVLFTRELGKRLHESGISVFSVYPGDSLTDIRKHITSKNTISRIIYWPFNYLYYKSAWKASRALMYAAFSRDLDNKNGAFINVTTEELYQLEGLTDSTTSERLWRTSELWSSRFNDENTTALQPKNVENLEA